LAFLIVKRRYASVYNLYRLNHIPLFFSGIHPGTFLAVLTLVIWIRANSLIERRKFFPIMPAVIVSIAGMFGKKARTIDQDSKIDN